MSGVFERKLSWDVIQALSEQEISHLMSRYKRHIGERSSKGLSSHGLETDYCYLQRAMQLRQPMLPCRAAQVHT